MSYNKWNTYLGWLVFIIATAVYFITLEDTVSLWDCGEYITAAYKLEVGHPPGAPLFMVLGRLFSFFAEPENVALWINRLSAISSSLTILFMFWTLTLLLKKIALKSKNNLVKSDQIAIFGSAFVGSLAYTFSDSFWFSAVEGEVYAMSSLFTAVIFWAILKWDEEMHVSSSNLQNDSNPNRWLLLIMFLLGLAIGVHLLGILVVPAIGFVIYFRMREQTSLKGIIITGLIAIGVLGFIQEGIIPGSIAMASSFEVAFVNSLGLPFFSGTIFFFVLLVALCLYLLRLATKKSNAILYNATMGLILLLIGYGSFAVIVIRSNANTPLDENDPENLVTLHAYLKREQYGSAPLLYGQYWNSKENDREMYKDRPPFYLRRYVVTKGEEVLKAFKDEKSANTFASKNGGSVEEKYFESNVNDREKVVPTYAQGTIFPRMYWDQEESRIGGYKQWSGYDENDGAATDLGKDGKRLPTFGENLTYFFRYQVNWMYMRYFMWNFAGRQNDIQGSGDNMRGNWISGFSLVDNQRLGDQSAAPYFTTENPSNNKFFYLPLILGLVGLIFHFYRAPKDAFVVFLAFLFTGFAILIYLNQKPFEPRERDYAYAGSFYFFAIWIGIGAYTLYEAFLNFTKKELIGIVKISAIALPFFALFDLRSATGIPNTISWIIISAIAIASVAGMIALRKLFKSNNQVAVFTTLLAFIVPVIMGMQGFDDHDRSLKSSARDLAFNYLESCEKNGIIFTNGDNDTFPLWYLQEVEGKRTDVRVCNLSLMQTDWYTEQMKMKAYDSDPLPIKFTEDQTLMYAGNTDQVLFASLFDMFYMNASEEVLDKVIEMRAKTNPAQINQATAVFNASITSILSGFSASQAQAQARVEELKRELVTVDTTNVQSMIKRKYRAAFELLSAIQGGVVKTSQEQGQAFQKAIMDFESSWNRTNLKEAMAFVRDENNFLINESRKLRIFPSSGFVLPVHKENAVKSGIIKQGQQKECLDEIDFNFQTQYITKEQVMMLDILANNDWKRGIYFSSPGGSDVAMALYQKGYIKQNGMAFELSPLSDLNKRFADGMYDKLMTTYAYNGMNNPDVLTDYYTRRHTDQYRMHFASLADDFLKQAEQLDAQRKQTNANIDFLKKTNQTAQIPALEKSLVGVDEKIAAYNKKAIHLIKRSLSVMPAELVIDNSEPSERGSYSNGANPLGTFTDGILYDYVGILYKAGDKDAAEKLGARVADQIESILNYFEKSNIYFALNPQNNKDLFAALDAYFKLSLTASDPIYGSPEGKLAKRTAAKIKALYSTTFPSMYNKAEQRANDAGESTRRGARSGEVAGKLFYLQDYIKAIAVHYGYLKGENNLQTPMSPMNMPMQEIPESIMDTTKP